ncbi:MAG TPA: Gfo/Idh/MocA family oxidoreductase [Gemmataceae bacterium]|jgi:predicted dehydrogenase|nr:Gfo/Idh/MocA family oxidoreductase [Gemmataceae bacterium]
MLDRRSFINHSAVIAAATAALRGTPLIADEPKKVESRLPGQTLRVAVVGVNGRGMSHVGGFNGARGCEITHICDVDPKVTSRAMDAVSKKRGKDPTFVQDIRRLLDDKTIDVVSIATPNHWHALASIWAMQAGKHVYVEKPCSHNVLEGRRMIQAARKYDRICQVGTQSRSMPGMRESIAYLHSGKLGKVKLAYGTCYKRRGSIGKVEAATPIPDGLDFDLWCGPAPKVPVMRKKLHYDWHWIWNYGNGDLGNQGVHEMDKARWGLNKNELPKSVVSYGGRVGYIDDGETANTQLCVFDYGDSELIFEVRGLESDSPFPGNLGGKKGSNFVGNIWYCEKGILVCPSYNSGVVLSPDLQVVQKFSGGSDGVHFENFTKAINTGKHEDLNCDIAEGHPSAALCHLANISYRLGKQTTVGELKDIAGSKEANDALKKMVAHMEDNKVDPKTTAFAGPLLTVDAKKEQFTGALADKANPMLTREYRKGFEIKEQV